MDPEKISKQIPMLKHMSSCLEISIEFYINPGLSYSNQAFNNYPQSFI